MIKSKRLYRDNDLYCLEFFNIEVVTPYGAHTLPLFSFLNYQPCDDVDDVTKFMNDWHSDMSEAMLSLIHFTSWTIINNHTIAFKDEQNAILCYMRFS